MEKYFRDGKLLDKEIVAALRKSVDNYERGAILEVRDELVDVVNSILEWEYEHDEWNE